MKTVLLVVVFGLALQASPAGAQTPTPPERPIDPEQTIPAPSARPDTPPYQVKIDRLAELIGSLTYLRDLCVPGEGAAWRSKVEDLIAAEGSTAERRDRLAGAFNRGFNGYRYTYKRCTPSAEAIIDRALAEGSRLAHEVSTTFGP